MNGNNTAERGDDERKRLFLRACVLMKKAKQQRQIGSLPLVRSKLRECERILEDGRYGSLERVIGILSEERVWHLRTGDAFSSSLVDFDSRVERFKNKRMEAIKKARAMLLDARKATSRDRAGQTMEVISSAEASLKTNTCAGAEEAIRLLDANYRWKYDSENGFSSRLADFDLHVSRYEESKSQKLKMEAEKRAIQEQEQIKKEIQVRRIRARELRGRFLKIVFGLAIASGAIVACVHFWSVVKIVLIVLGVIVALVIIALLN
jgi:hypothetical protein